MIKPKRVITTLALSVAMLSPAVPCFAYTNSSSFNFEYTGGNGSVNGLLNGVTRYLDKGYVELDVTSVSNVTSKKPSNITLYRYRSTDSDICYGTISVSNKGTTTFSKKAGVASSNYYLTASGGVSGKQVKVKGSLRNK